MIMKVSMVATSREKEQSCHQEGAHGIFYDAGSVPFLVLAGGYMGVLLIFIHFFVKRIYVAYVLLCLCTHTA